MSIFKEKNDFIKKDNPLQNNIFGQSYDVIGEPPLIENKYRISDSFIQRETDTYILRVTDSVLIV